MNVSLHSIVQISQFWLSCNKSTFILTKITRTWHEHNNLWIIIYLNFVRLAYEVIYPKHINIWKCQNYNTQIPIPQFIIYVRRTHTLRLNGKVNGRERLYMAYIKCIPSELSLGYILKVICPIINWPALYNSVRCIHVSFDIFFTDVCKEGFSNLPHDFLPIPTFRFSERAQWQLNSANMFFFCSSKNTTHTY